MRAPFRLLYVLLLAVAFSGPALAAEADPTLNQVYDTVRAGHPQEAQRMMKQVLRDHPKSAKAHYVAAEVNAAAGDLSQAREELRVAEGLEPGLPFAKPESVRELRDKLSRRSSFRPQSGGGSGGISWGVLLVIVIGVGVVVALVMRRRPPSNFYPAPPPSSAAGSTGGVIPPGAPPPSTGSGIGSSIAGGLAGGLAAGAGIVAGEEIARHLLGSGEREVPPTPTEPEQHADADLGGNDFGVSDPDSWDDDQQDSSSGGGDDDSWS